LYFVDVSYNYELDNDTFAYFRGVHELHLDRGEYGYVGYHSGRRIAYRDAFFTSEAFENLRGIHTLSMRRCDHIQDEAFINLRGIQILCMDHCHSITDAAFESLRGIHTLTLVGCSQDTITDTAFESLRGIKTLDLSGMGQWSISDKAFENLIGIERIVMCGSHTKHSYHPFLPTISDKAFAYLRGAQELTLELYSQSESSIHNLTRVYNLAQIHTLKLAGNISFPEDPAPMFRGVSVLDIACGVLFYADEDNAVECLSRVKEMILRNAMHARVLSSLVARLKEKGVKISYKYC